MLFSVSFTTKTHVKVDFPTSMSRVCPCNVAETENETNSITENEGNSVTFLVTPCNSSPHCYDLTTRSSVRYMGLVVHGFMHGPLCLLDGDGSSTKVRVNMSRCDLFDSQKGG